MYVDKFGHTWFGPEQGANQQTITIGQLNADFLRRDGTNSATGNLDIGANLIRNMQAPITGLDAANRNYVDDEIGNSLLSYLKLDGTKPMSGDLNINTHFVYGVKDPIIAQDASTKQYVDDRIAAVNNVLSTIIATSTVANVSISSTNVYTLPITLQPVILFLDPTKPNNPSDPTTINCVNGGTTFRIFKPGTFTIGFNALFSNSTTNQITVSGFLRDAGSGTDLITIPPVLCTPKPNAGAPNTTTSFNINNQFTLLTIPPVPGYVDISIYTQASEAGVSSLYRDGFLALSITQDSTPYLPLSGGVMTGDINMGNKAIINLKAPAVGADATTKTYVDTAITTAIPIVDRIIFELIGTVGIGTTKLPWASTRVSSNYATYFTRGPANGDHTITNTNYSYTFRMELVSKFIGQSNTASMDDAITPFNVLMSVTLPPNSNNLTHQGGTFIKDTGAFNFVNNEWDNSNGFRVICDVTKKYTLIPVPS